MRWLLSLSKCYKTPQAYRWKPFYFQKPASAGFFVPVGSALGLSAGCTSRWLSLRGVVGALIILDSRINNTTIVNDRINVILGDFLGTGIF
ncbi:Unannotated [Lentimonas sp. CC4]|nr:Unannotated [Lentimonas sp. CC4]CAA6685147.1 Unannotated [Lentimonas sp. CC6]CAA7075126.1 Unannotated [Lentimonas sp. CC4]CAA7168413.1 Unannotated [Lentimonas sp. CC21]CAA7182151.1 Unannotated [Lentimonas sp. CC8]